MKLQIVCPDGQYHNISGKKIYSLLPNHVWVHTPNNVLTINWCI